MRLMRNSLVLLANMLVLVACGGGGGGSSSAPATPSTPTTPSAPSTPATYTVGGSVSGLGSGNTLVLRNNGGDARTITADGNFTFATALSAGAAYAVTVGTQPTGRSCSVSNGAGTIGSANVTNVAVVCAVTPAAACSSAASAPVYSSDPIWASYSAPTGPTANSTPAVTAELPNPFAACLGG